MSHTTREEFEALGLYGAVWKTPEPPPAMRAAASGDAHTLARLIHADPELPRSRERCEPQETLLHKAARGAHAAAARVLVVGGADPSELNCQGQDAFAVLLSSTALEQSLCSTARVLLAAAQTSPDQVRTRQAVYFDPDLQSDDETTRRHAEEDAARLRALDGTGRLRAVGQDCPRLCALLLRRSDASNIDACRAALALAEAAGHWQTARVVGHWQTARVVGHWLRLRAGDTDPSDAPYPDLFPEQKFYHRCPGCLAWWIAASDDACPNCGGAALGDLVRMRQPAWWPWGQVEAEPPSLEAQEEAEPPSLEAQEEAEPPSLEAQEEATHQALWDLACRAARIGQTRAQVLREARSEGTRTLGERLSQVASAVRVLQMSYEYALWLAETVRWWNSLELAVADWECLTFEQCGRRIEWCGTLRRRWRATLTEWEYRHAAERLALGGHGEPDAVVQARHALYGCGQVQQGLLASRAALAVRANGRAGGYGRLPACPVEPYCTRLKATTDLARRCQDLEGRLARLGESGMDDGG